MKINILQNFTKKNYSNYPFPYFEINNCLPEDVYNALSKDYNEFINFFNQNEKIYENNIRLQISSEEFFNTPIFKNSIWYDFIYYHTSKDFLKDIVGIFYEDIIKYFPKISFSDDKIQNSGIRSNINNEKKDFVLDCQPGINTKAIKKSSVRGPHIDNPHEIIGGLFYLSDVDDKDGGDLQIFETKKKILFHEKAEVYNINDLSLLKTIRYQRNNVFFFVNSIKSIHSVTERNVSDHFRKLTNIIVERYIDGYNFKMPRKENLFNKIFKKIYK